MNPIAQFSADEIAPMIASVLLFMIPIIAILTAHQRKMAEIIHRGQSHGTGPNELDSLRMEISRLTQAIHQNTIAVDNLVQQQNPSAAPRLAGELPPDFSRLEA